MPALVAFITMLAVPAAVASSGQTSLPQLVRPAAVDSSPERVRAEAARRQELSERRAVRRKRRTSPRKKAKPAARPVAVPPQLQAIAACESGGNPRAIGGGGQFRGKYQFTVATWQAVGGQGDPAQAPEAEQDRRAHRAAAAGRAGPVARLQPVAFPRCQSCAPSSRSSSGSPI